MNRSSTRLISAVLAVAVVALAGAAGAAESPATPVVSTTFLGTVVTLGDLGPRASTFTLRLHVDKLTPDGEAARLTEVLRKQGETALASELGARDLGYLQLGTRFPERLQAAFLDEVDGARHLVLITQRPFSARETFRNARSADYRFRVVEVILDGAGNGAGAMLGAARFRLEKDGTLGARNLGIVPWRIVGMRALKG